MAVWESGFTPLIPEHAAQSGHFILVLLSLSSYDAQATLVYSLVPLAVPFATEHSTKYMFTGNASSGSLSSLC